jgi:hypothetical protein
MKHLKIITLLIIAVTTISASCKKTKDPGPNSFYFQCKINGQPYIPDLGNGLTCELLADTTLLLGGNIGFQALTTGINDHSKIHEYTYTLNDSIGQQGTYKNSTMTNDRYFTDSIHTGQLTIILIDKTNKIIQGTFFFKAYNAYRDDSVSITDGKFRLHYIIS